MINGWLAKSFFSAFAVIPFILILSAFDRAYSIRPESAILYWFIGIVFGMFSYTAIGKGTYLITPNTCLLVIAFLGVVFGVAANILLVQAVIEAPNLGLPMTIVGANSAMIFLIGPVLAYLLPKYFEQIKFDGVYFFGITLVLVGLGVISLHK